MTANYAQRRCNDVVEDSIQSGANVLVEALPGLGKTYSTAKAAVEGDLPITYLTHRTDLREEVLETATDLGLPREEILFLKSAEELCPTYRGDHREEWRADVRRLRAQGVMPGDLHRQGALPCCQEGSVCDYSKVWSFDPEDYRLIVGHPSHAHIPAMVEGRVVVYDEFPREGYLTEIEDLHAAVDPYLEARDSLPFDDLYGLLSAPIEDRLEAIEALSYTNVTERDVEASLNAGAHSRANLAAWGLLVGVDLGNGYTHAELEGVIVSTWRSKIDGKAVPQAAILLPPDFRGARGVVALDGTPTPEMWEAVLGEELEHTQVLTDEERASYLREQGLRFVRTTEAAKPYSSGRYVNVEEDAALLHEVREVHGERPSVVTSKAALREYEREGLLHEYVDNHQLYFGNMRGSNTLKSKRIGIVLGSPHHGDGKLKKWGALLGESVEPARVGGQRRTIYGETGETLLKHIREAEVLQAALRFGRDGGGSTVYLHTGAVPEWLPVEEGGVRPYKTKEAAILSALREGDSLTAKEIAERAGVTPRYVRSVLKRLDVEGEKDSMDKRVRRYSLKGDANPYGEVDLPSPCESIAQVPEPSPIIESYSRWFRNPCYSLSSEEWLSVGEVTPPANTSSPSDWIRWPETSEEAEL